MIYEVAALSFVCVYRSVCSRLFVDEVRDKAISDLLLSDDKEPKARTALGSWILLGDQVREVRDSATKIRYIAVILPLLTSNLPSWRWRTDPHFLVSSLLESTLLKP